MNKFKFNPTDIFWFNLSFSAIIISIGITWSLIKGSTIDLEANSTKFKLSGIAAENKQITKELQKVSENLKQVPSSPEKIEVIEEIEKELTETELKITAIEEEIEDEIIQNDRQDGNGTDKNKPEKDNGIENN